jgi:hypothetical protein
MIQHTTRPDPLESLRLVYKAFPSLRTVFSALLAFLLSTAPPYRLLLTATIFCFEVCEDAEGCDGEDGVGGRGLLRVWDGRRAGRVWGLDPLS